MKKVGNLLIVLLLISGVKSEIKSQEILKADAGENQHFCFETDWIATELGGNPTAIGGIPPYTYRWWAKPYCIFFSETDSNPSIAFLGDIAVYVEVTDFVGNIAIDSAFITMSNQQINFADDPQNLQIDYYINRGDSVFLTGNVSVLNPNSTFTWSPCESIINDCNIPDGIWVKPTNTTIYTLTAIDEFNCSETYFTHFYKVYVSAVSIKNNNIASNIFIYPNPTNETSFLNISNYNGEINYQVLDIQGKIIFKKNVNIENKTELPVQNLAPGIYFVKVKTNSEIFILKLFKKQK